MRFSLLLFFLLFFTPFSIGASSPLHTDTGKEEDLLPLRSLSVKVVDNNSSFILAAERTHRRDPSNGFKAYNGGWNISDNHYWASVAFTAFPLFIIAVVWFLGFGLILLFTCFCYCCCPRKIPSYSRIGYTTSLVLLILFTVSAIIGCIVLYTGQGKFNSTTSNILDFVVEQADVTVENLRNFTDDLSSAKKIEIDQQLLPPDILPGIDSIAAELWNGMSRSLRQSKVGFLDKAIGDVNRYYRSRWKVKGKEFLRNNIFGTWKILTFLAAGLLLFMTCVQAFCSVYSYSAHLNKWTNVGREQ